MKKTFIIGGIKYSVEIVDKNVDQISFKINDSQFSFAHGGEANGKIVLQEGKKRHQVSVGQVRKDLGVHVFVEGIEAFVHIESRPNQGRSLEKAEDNVLVSPMPGKIFKILKNVGEMVNKGETILILEAMKMEHAVKAQMAGELETLLVEENQMVQGGVELATIKQLDQ